MLEYAWLLFAALLVNLCWYVAVATIRHTEPLVGRLCILICAIGVTIYFLHRDGAQVGRQVFLATAVFVLCLAWHYRKEFRITLVRSLVALIVILFAMQFLPGARKPHPLPPHGLFAFLQSHSADTVQPPRVEDVSGDVLVAVAVSGGGSRAAYFGAAFLAELEREYSAAGSGTQSGKSFFEEVDVLSGVSGGGLLALALANAQRDDFSGHSPSMAETLADVREAMTTPFQWHALFRRATKGVLLHPFNGYGMLDGFHDAFDSTVFRFALLSDLPSRPLVAISTADVSHGGLVRFDQATMSSPIGVYDAQRTPLSWVAAASSAVPGVLDAFTVTVPTGKGEESTLRLVDGGVIDNLALSGLADGIALANKKRIMSGTIGYKGVLLLVIDASPLHLYEESALVATATLLLPEQAPSERTGKYRDVSDSFGVLFRSGLSRQMFNQLGRLAPVERGRQVEDEHILYRLDLPAPLAQATHPVFSSTPPALAMVNLQSVDRLFEQFCADLLDGAESEFYLARINDLAQELKSMGVITDDTVLHQQIEHMAQYGVCLDQTRLERRTDTGVGKAASDIGTKYSLSGRQISILDFVATVWARYYGPYIRRWRNQVAEAREPEIPLATLEEAMQEPVQAWADTAPFVQLYAVDDDGQPWDDARTEAAARDIQILGLPTELIRETNNTPKGATQMVYLPLEMSKSTMRRLISLAADWYTRIAVNYTSLPYARLGQAEDVRPMLSTVVRALIDEETPATDFERFLLPVMDPRRPVSCWTLWSGARTCYSTMAECVEQYRHLGADGIPLQVRVMEPCAEYPFELGETRMLDLMHMSYRHELRNSVGRDGGVPD